MLNEVELNALVGTHVVDGVGEFIAPSTDCVREDARVFLIRIDGRVHAFSENPCDGYRSMLRGIEVLSDDHADVRRVIQFAPRECHFTKRDKKPGCPDESEDVLVVTDALTGHCLLEIGTTYVDDYYPHFVSHWTPI